MKSFLFFGLSSVFFFLISNVKPASAESNYSGNVQALFWITTAGSILVGILVFGLLLYFVYKYRETTNVPRNRVKNEIKFERMWIAFAIILVVILVGISTPILLQEENPAGQANAVEVKVLAHTFAWNLTFDGVSYNTQFNNTIPMKVNVMYMLNMTSLDVIHSFFSYDLSIKKDVVPGQYNIQYFKILNPGDYVVTCAELCGPGHYNMHFIIHATT